jgi:hypothetical protein
MAPVAAPNDLRELTWIGGLAAATGVTDWALAALAEHGEPPVDPRDVSHGGMPFGPIRVGLVTDSAAAHGTRPPRDPASAIVAGGLAAVGVSAALALHGHPGSNMRVVAAGLLVGGTVANLANRFAFGRVQNYFITRHRAFNLADVAAGVGALGIIASLAIPAARQARLLHP